MFPTEEDHPAAINHTQITNSVLFSHVPLINSFSLVLFVAIIICQHVNENH